MEKPALAHALVVDDEPLIRWSLAKALADEGFAVLQAADARTATRLADTPGLDVILLDLKLPDSGDLGLLAQLRSVAPSARLVLMTAFGTPETKARALELGAAAVVDKPFGVRAVVVIALEGVLPPRLRD